MLISLSGRKCSGKSLLAEELEAKYGFKRVGFADYLKKSVAELYGWDISWLYDPIKKEEIFDEKPIWDEEVARRFSEIVEQIIPVVEKAEFTSIRHSLTHIGTVVLRKIDPNFHVNKTFSNIDLCCDIVFEDVRFANELTKIRSTPDNLSIFIIRPFNMNYSNDLSEISLNRKMFDKIIINDSSKRSFIDKSIDLIKNKTSNVINDDSFYEKNEHSCRWAEVLSSGEIKNNSLEVCCDKDVLVDLCKFMQHEYEIIDGKINITSPYIIEDLKMWEFFKKFQN